VACLFCYAAIEDDTALLSINSQDFRVNLKNYLGVYVKIVPACDLFITIVAIFRYFLLRSSVLSTTGSAGILVASIVRELLGGPVVLRCQLVQLGRRSRSYS
jgi:hypothetical protein